MNNELLEKVCAILRDQAYCFGKQYVYNVIGHISDYKNIATYIH